MASHDPGGLTELSALFELRNENKRLREMRGVDNGLVLPKILVAIIAALALAGIIGVVTMYRENGELRAGIAENARRMDRIENYIYRERR